jgi:predicted acyltransferase
MTDTPTVKRLRSLDALRGFDMFWIIGGGKIFAALAVLTGWPVLRWWAHQLHHMKWHGFHFEDMIFPLFLFIAGISFPFSMAKRCQTPEGRSGMYQHVIQRGLVLVLLGIFNNNGIRFDVAGMRFGSVLGHIGLAWMFAALIFMNSEWKSRVVWFWGILIGYWALLWFFPAHDLGSSDPYSMEGCLVGRMDRMFMPGRLYKTIHDPEGILSTLPAIATALLGMLTGGFILSDRMDDQPLKKVLLLVVAAAGLMVLGLLWNLVFPINKNLWTSSFVCYVGGLSLVLFALFYLVIDVWGFKGWDTFFVVIGMNSITIYLAPKLIDFQRPVNTLFGSVIAALPKDWAGVMDATAYMAVVWVCLYVLYRKKIFLKV